MSLLFATAVGVVATRFLLILLRSVLESPVLQRVNYRGIKLGSSAGLVVVLSVVVVESSRSVLGVLNVGRDSSVNDYRTPVVFACLAFGFLGTIDDILATGEDRGFKGHLLALRHGRLTTGAVKLFGGAAIALFLAAPGNPVSGLRLVADAVLIALAANLANLFDRAPGRLLKFSLLAWLPLVIWAALSDAGSDQRLVGVPVAIVMGASLALFGEDIREKLMLGDSGANVIGAVLGLQVVFAADRATRNVVLAILIALNLISEFVSFGKVIERVAPLRAFDRLGRRSS